MNEYENGKMEEQTSPVAAKPEKRRSTDGDGEPGVVRIRLPAAVGIRAKETVAELRTRGAQVTLDDLLADYIEGVPERYFDTQLQKRTPEPYYLEAAAKIPELREMLIRQAKKGLLRSATPLVEPRAARRPRRKAVGAEMDANPTVASTEAK